MKIKTFLDYEIGKMNRSARGASYMLIVPPTRGIRDHSEKYDIKLHLMRRLQICSSEDCEVFLNFNYSQVQIETPLPVGINGSNATIC